MAFIVKNYSPEPIIAVTIVPPHDPAADIVGAGREIQQFAASIEGPVFAIMDMSAVHSTFGQVVQGLDVASHSKSEMIDPRIQSIFVGSDDMLSLAVQSAAQQQYGGARMPLFSSVDAALAHARSELARNT